MDIGWGTIALSLGTALIGTLLGARSVIYLQGTKHREIRKLAVKSLNIIKKYAKQRYSAANNDFNASLNLAEKRAILVSLHKVGVPIAMPTAGTFAIKEVAFLDETINKDEISDMIAQINSGNCDHIFFEDIDTYFNKDLREKTIRNIAKKYVNDFLRKSKIDKNSDSVIFEENIMNKFTQGEFNVIAVFRKMAMRDYYYKEDSTADAQKIDILLDEIDVGLWDKYLYRDIIEHEQLFANVNMMDLLTSAFKPQQQKATPLPKEQTPNTSD